jgi:hypothetical protein
MTQADSVHSTTPTNTSANNPARPVIDPTRRGFITLAAGASIISVGSLAAVAMPISTTPVSDAPIDPIFAAIEAHRKASAAADAASAEVKRLCELADKVAGSRQIDIPSMIEPGTTVKASIWLDIEEAIPSAQFPEQYAHYLALLEERHAARFSVTGDTDPIGEEEYEAEWDARGDFADTMPTTLAGLLAMIIYAGEVSERDAEAFADSNCSLIETLAAGAKAVQS